MQVLTRKGFTLLELLVALAIGSVVGLAIYKMLVGNQRVFRAQTQRIDLQENLRISSGIFAQEFRELDAGEGDIVTASSNLITIRAMRRLGFLCNPPTLGGLLTGRTMTVRSSPAFGSPATFSAGDSIFVFYDGNQQARTDDGWVAGKVTAVAPVPCPAPDNGAGQQLTLDLAALVAPKVNAAGNITSGSPVRAFETVTYKAYQHSDGKWYVAVTNTNGTQPLIGPLTGSEGLSFTYYDAAGAVTAVPANIAAILVKVVAQTADKVAAGGSGGTLVNPTDSISVRVTLRNNPRF